MYSPSSLWHLLSITTCFWLPFLFWTLFNGDLIWGSYLSSSIINLKIWIIVNGVKFKELMLYVMSARYLVIIHREEMLHNLWNFAKSVTPNSMRLATRKSIKGKIWRHIGHSRWWKTAWATRTLILWVQEVQKLRIHKLRSTLMWDLMLIRVQDCSMAYHQSIQQIENNLSRKEVIQKDPNTISK